MLLTPKKIIMRGDFLCAKLLPVIEYKRAIKESHAFMKENPNAWSSWNEDPIDDFLAMLITLEGNMEAAKHFVKETDLAIIAWFDYNLQASKAQILKKDPLEQIEVPDDNACFLQRLLYPGLL